MNCIEILSSFLKSINIDSYTYYGLFDRLISSQPIDEANVSSEQGIKSIQKILIDTYTLNSPKVKKCADIISREFCPIGRREKDLIKHYLDYNDNDSLIALKKVLDFSDETFKRIEKIINDEFEDLSSKAELCFIENWYAAIDAKDDSKIFDYLQGIYSRLTSLLNENYLSLLDIYKYNSHFIAEELKPVYQAELLNFCSNDSKISAKEARTTFCKKYESILLKSLQEDSNNDELDTIMNRSSSFNTPFESLLAEDYKLVFLNIDQDLYDQSLNHDDFLNRVLSLLYYSYRVLDNHRTLAINIDNIFTAKGQNLKWMLYSYIGIYAEHFIPTVENRNFYKPEELCFAKCQYLGIKLNEEKRSLIKQFFKGNVDISEVQSSLNITEQKLNRTILDYEKIWYGYTFSDCFVIESGKYKQNKEISFIKNTNQILLIFNKYRHDDRKIPCPECAGLDISGNSFPEVGLRSWECKNSICPSRSKSNRGKRYSKKSNFMQLGFETGDANDIVSRDMIKQWRRDIVKVNSQAEIYNMLIKYFSFNNEKVLFVNEERNDSVSFSNYGRKVSYINLQEIISMRTLENEFDNYFRDGDYIIRYLNQISRRRTKADTELNRKLLKTKGAMLAHGDSRKILSKISDNTFTAAVTSPPYYNAREYSQWPNFYLYLSDMYDIIKETYRTMKPGGIYLYNVGDICGNENTVVSSKMGEKRILLGAYTVHLFTSAGFELLDDILWDKGEPQSNRQMNDGKFTPFYQKPMNVYEHMFIFKKPGARTTVNKNITDVLPKNWDKNIVNFKPVFKINCNGENTLGHTAPFPEDIPNFVARVFTRSKNDIVLEPFAGSGTSMIAATKADVKSLGIELSEEYVDLSIKIGKENNINIVQL